jgi:hypothetical protein
MATGVDFWVTQWPLQGGELAPLEDRFWPVSDGLSRPPHRQSLRDPTRTFANVGFWGDQLRFPGCLLLLFLQVHLAHQRFVAGVANPCYQP